MNDWVPIRYRGFYDVPRVFLVNYQNQVFLFSCLFNEEIDAYSDTYKVYILPPLADEELEGNWEELFGKSTQYVGEVPVREVQFDPSFRREVNTKVIDNLRCVSGRKAN